LTTRRLRVLAIVALAGGVGAVLVELFAAFHLAGTVGVPQAELRPGRIMVWLLVAFGLFAVAEVIRRGCAMRDELDTVVECLRPTSTGSSCTSTSSWRAVA
jgi:hypothetical protein